MSWSPRIYTAISYREQAIFSQQKECIHHSPRRDAAAALVGSLGLVPSINAGDNFVMGEPYVISIKCHNPT